MSNQVPWLREGTGRTPAEGGCVMQVVDWISRNEWTDAPPCVHPVIRSLAIAVNDRLDDKGRQQLLVLVPRMMNTAVKEDANKTLTRKLLGHLARVSYPLYSEWAEKSNYDDKGSVLACIEAAERGESAEAAWAAWAARAAEAAWAAWAARAAEAAWAAEAAEAAEAAGAAEAAEAKSDYLGLLVGLLNRYDELVPREPQDAPDYAPVCEVLSDDYVRCV